MRVGLANATVLHRLVVRHTDQAPCHFRWSSPLVNVAEEKLALADAMALPFADARFDAIIMIHLLHLVSDW